MTLISANHTTGPYAKPRNRWALLALLPSLAFAFAGCGLDGNSDEASGESEAALSGGDILGFESTSGWTVSSGSVSSSSTRTQGSHALAVAAPNDPTLTSAASSSTTAQLAALTDTGSSIALDMLMPTAQPNPGNPGMLQLLVTATKEKVSNVSLGKINLAGQPLGAFQTYKFAVPDSVRTPLKGKSFSDLTFKIVLTNSPGTTGTYVFDNLRAVSPNTQKVGPGKSIDMVASLGGLNNGPGTADFTAGTIQIPASLHITNGVGSSGGATLALGFGTTVNTTCSYVVAVDAKSFVFSKCTSGNVAGDLVAASHAQLAILAPAMLATSVRAQLAYNVLGDQVGTKLVPAVPTFWGDTAAEIDAIGTAFVQAQHNAPPPETRVLNLPVPEYAKRHATGAPDGGATPVGVAPNDPPFLCAGGKRCEGHMNANGDFDAFWTLDGGLTIGSSNNDFNTQFTMTFGTHVVLFGSSPIDVTTLTTTANTDTGTVTQAGFVNPSANAEMIIKLFGIVVEDKKVNGEVPFGPFNLVEPPPPFNAPPVRLFGIITITAGVNVNMNVVTTGKIAFAGPSITVTPTAQIGAHVTGAIDVGFASGGVDVKVDLIKATLPITASALWSVNTDPAVCSANITFDVNGKLALSTLGGEVDLQATVGVCPFCWKDNFTLFSWTGVTLAQAQIFDVNATNELTALPTALCVQPVTITLQQPVNGATLTAGLPVSGSAFATRPAPMGQILPVQIPCADLTWTSSDPTFVPQTGCTPSLTFGTTGNQTLTLTAADQFGDKAVTTINVTVNSQVGPRVSVVSPLQNQIIVVNGTGSAQVTFQLNVAPGSLTDPVLVQFFDSAGNDIADVPVAPTGQAIIPVTTVVPVAPGVPSVLQIEVTDTVTGQNFIGGIRLNVENLT